MKKINYLIIGLVLVVLSLGFALTGHAQDTTRQIKISWEDTNAKTDDFRWLLFVRSEGEGFGLPVATIPIADTTRTEPTYHSSPTTITITGTPGSTVTKYFAMRAQRGQGDTEETSAMSAEVAHSFDIPMTAPFSITIEVVIVPE